MSNSLSQAQPLPGCRGRDNFICKGFGSCLALFSSELEVPSSPGPSPSAPSSSWSQLHVPAHQVSKGFFLKSKWKKGSCSYEIFPLQVLEGICLLLQGTCTARAAAGQAQGTHSSSICEHTLPSVLKSRGGRKIPDEGEGATMSNHCRAILS